MGIRSFPPVYQGLLPFAQIGVYVTRFVTDLMLFVIIRDFMSSLGGFVLFFGEEKGRVVFRPVFNLIVLGSLAWFYTLTPASPYTGFMGVCLAIFMFYIINVFAKKGRNNVYATILSIYYLYFLYVSVSSLNFATMVGAFVSDLFITLIMFFFIAKGAVTFLNRANLKMINTDNLILLFLGFVLLFHAVAVAVATGTGQGTLLELQFKFSLANCVIIILSSQMLFTFSKEYRDFMTSQPGKINVAVQVVKGVLKELVGKKD